MLTDMENTLMDMRIHYQLTKKNNIYSNSLNQ